MARTTFSRYLTPLPRDEAWGVTVTAGGRHLSPPGAPYPPTGHPADHRFDWRHGRILGAYQIVHIVAGTGRFESRATGELTVKAGQVLLLFPSVWHRYQPNVATGWTEEWLELRGPLLKRLEQSRLLSRSHPVISSASGSGIRTIFHRILGSLEDGGPRPDPIASGLALELIAILHAERSRHVPPKSIAVLIAKAEELLHANIADPPELESVAQGLGIAYSHFRREFKAATGIAPAKYVRLLRLEKARRLLGATTSPIKRIAEETGFSSEFHLSAAFKKEFGTAPGTWRKRGNSPNA